MQITETVSDGLHREYKIVIGAADLDARLVGRIEEMKPQVQLKGFRKGKAPLSYLKKNFGKSMMGEIVEAAVSESSEKAIKDNALKLATQPQVELVSEIGQVVEGKSDLEFTMKVDLMPEFELADVSKLEIEKLVADVTDAEVDETIERLAKQARTYTPRGEGEAAELDDQMTLDFVGRIDGEEFPGGKAEDFRLVLGSGQFIPGFEEQLVGAKTGDDREVKVTFPEDYRETKLAGKEAAFSVKVKGIAKPDPVAIDNSLAEKLGLDSIGTLKDRIRDQLKNEYAQASRIHLKRRVLDALDTAHKFAPPQTMVEGEFSGIWRAVEAELEREGKTIAEVEDKSEDELKEEYREIAARRVRLGLVLARIGEQNGISVTNDEIQRAVVARARQFPGQEQQVFNFYASNPQAQAEIRAPLFEDKVVDFIAELATVNERKVDRETLLLDPDEAAEKLKAAG
jgi:trigger factor